MLSNYDTQIYTVTTDEQGEWSLTIPQNFEPGLHAVIAESQTLQIKDPALFTLQLQELPPVEEVIIPFPFFIFTSLLFIIAGLGLYAISLARQAQKCAFALEKQDILRKSAYAKRSIFVASGALILAIVLSFGYGPYRELVVNQVRELTSIQEEIKEIIIPVVRGQIVDPISMQGIKEVSVSSGQTASITSETGIFTLTNVKNTAGVTITHPLLTKKWILQNPQEQQTVYFNAEAYNTLAKEFDVSSQDITITSLSVSEKNALLIDVVKDNVVILYEITKDTGTWVAHTR